VRRTASWLASRNWPQGSKVAIIGKNSAHWILADLAIQMAGHVSVPIYPTFNGEALRYILQHSETRACFVGKMDDTNNLQSGVPPRIAFDCPATRATHQGPGLGGSAGPEQAPMRAQPAPDLDALCTIIYTSGTTGKPKGVVHTYRSMAWGVTSATRRVHHGLQ
jgi:long-chain acyl-CoA synthetase